jgi:sporulation protein YunB
MKFRRAIKYIKITLIIAIFLFLLNFISNYFSRRVDVYVAQKARLEASKIISEAISESVLPHIDMDTLIKMMGEDSKIDSIYINTYQINEIMAKTSLTIQRELDKIENDEKLNNLVVPFSIILGDFLLYEYGPDIYINIYPVGSAFCDVVTTFDNYGINNTLLEINIVVDITLATVIPLQKQLIDVRTKIPIVVQVIQGKVPTYYYSNTDSEYLPNPVKLE